MPRLSRPRRRVSSAAQRIRAAPHGWFRVILEDDPASSFEREPGVARVDPVGGLIRAALIVLVLALPASARADGHVTSLRPWATGNEYYVEQDLDGRAQPTVEPRAVVDYLREGQWVKIECQ